MIPAVHCVLCAHTFSFLGELQLYRNISDIVALLRSSKIYFQLCFKPINSEKMVLLSGEEFLGEMTKLFQGCREIGSVVFTVKPYDGQDRPEPRTGAPGKWKKQKLVLIRVSY